MALNSSRRHVTALLWQGGLLKYLAAFGTFLLAAIVASATYRTLGATGLAMVFLAAVLVSAVSLGARAGYLTAFLAFVSYDFYIAAPRYTFEVNSPADMVVLTMFPFVAFLTGGLAGRARDEGQKAKARENAANVLYAASRQISSIWDEAEIRRQLARHMAIAAQAPAVVWTAEESFSDSMSATQLPQPSRFPSDLPPPGWQSRDLRHEEPALGSAAWRSAGPRSNEVDRLLDILVDLGAAAIVRARVGAARSEVETLANTEKLRSALLSSISHDFRTPLAVILASATSLRTFSGEMNWSAREDLLTTIQEEAERLNRFVTNLMHMAKLESGVVESRPSIIDIAEVVHLAAQRLGRGRWEGRLTTTLDDLDLLIDGDPILLDHALGNVVENALCFSAANQTVDIRAFRMENSVQIEVIDQGPGVPPEHLARIFDKFYQTGKERPDSPGVGLGLSIARGLIEAMKGSITARNRKDAPGLKVTISMPAHG